MKLKFIIAFVFLLIPLISAYNVEIQLDSNLEDFHTDVYECSNSECDYISFYTSSNTGTNSNSYTLSGSGNDYYAEYDYKECFKPHIYRNHVWGDEQENYTFPVIFNQKEDCQAHINGLEAPENIEVGETITITSSIHSAFEYPEDIPETTAIPLNIRDEYSSNVKVVFYVNGEEIDEQQREILLASDEEFETDWTPDTPGSYEIVVESSVIDCVCSSQDTQTLSIIVEVTSPVVIECYVDEDCGDPYCPGNPNYCIEEDVYQDFIFPTCNNPGEVDSYCSEEIAPWLVQECECGCSNGLCLDCPEPPEPVCGNLIIEEGEECDDGNLENGDGCDENCEIEEIPCLEDEDCPEDYYEDNYCLDNDVYRDFIDWFCEDCVCDFDVIPELVESCEYDCVDGECIDEPQECCDDSDCSEDYYEDNYCSGNDIYRKFHDFFCDLGICNENIITELIEECDEDCEDGECVEDDGRRRRKKCCYDEKCEDYYYTYKRVCDEIDKVTTSSVSYMDGKLDVFGETINLNKDENIERLGQDDSGRNNNFWLYLFLIASIVLIILILFVLVIKK